MLDDAFVFLRSRGSERLTFSSSVNSFSDTTGEVGLGFMKSLKLLDLCKVSCGHTKEEVSIIRKAQKHCVNQCKQLYFSSDTVLWHTDNNCVERFLRGMRTTAHQTHRHQSGSYNVCMWPLLKHLITNAAEQLCRKHRHWALIRDIVCINSALVWSCMSLLWVCKTSQVLQLYTRSTNYSFSESSVLWIKCQEVLINVLYPLKMICYQRFEMKEVELAVLPLKTT